MEMEGKVTAVGAEALEELRLPVHVFEASE